VLYSASIVFGMTVKEIDDAGPKKAARLIQQISKMFTSPMPEIAPRRIGPYHLQYDVAEITFGQYIDLAFFIQRHFANAHYILASMSSKRRRKYCAEGHPERANRFLEAPAASTIGAVKVILASFQAFNSQYPTLFGLPGESVSDGASNDRFNKRYGWQYNASAVAEYERISLDEAYALPVRNAFNDLIFLKEKVKYEIRERDRLMKEFKLQKNG
jgi:hypothetical protein